MEEPAPAPAPSLASKSKLSDGDAASADGGDALSSKVHAIAQAMANIATGYSDISNNLVHLASQIKQNEEEQVK